MSPTNRGRIQVTDATRRLLGDAFRCVDPAVRDVKGKGPLRTWFLEG